MGGRGPKHGALRAEEKAANRGVLRSPDCGQCDGLQQPPKPWGPKWEQCNPCDRSIDTMTKMDLGPGPVTPCRRESHPRVGGSTGGWAGGSSGRWADGSSGRWADGSRKVVERHPHGWKPHEGAMPLHWGNNRPPNTLATEMTKVGVRGLGGTENNWCLEEEDPTT